MKEFKSEKNKETSNTSSPKDWGFGPILVGVYENLKLNTKTDQRKMLPYFIEGRIEEIESTMQSLSPDALKSAQESVLKNLEEGIKQSAKITALEDNEHMARVYKMLKAYQEELIKRLGVEK